MGAFAIGMDLSDGRVLESCHKISNHQWTMITSRPQTTFKVRLAFPSVYQSHCILEELTTQSYHDTVQSFRYRDEYKKTWFYDFRIMRNNSSGWSRRTYELERRSFLVKIQCWKFLHFQSRDIPINQPDMFFLAFLVASPGVLEHPLPGSHWEHHFRSAIPLRSPNVVTGPPFQHRSEESTLPWRKFSETSGLVATSLHFHGCQR